MARLILVLIVLSVIAAGCGSSENQLKQQVIDANSGLDTYTASIQTEMVMTLNFLGQDVEIVALLDKVGDIDSKNKRLGFEGTVTSVAQGESSVEETAVYIIGDTLYTKQGDAWIKSTGDNLWEEQNDVNQIIQLLESSELTIGEEEIIDGTTYIVVDAVPDLKKLYAIQGSEIDETLLGDATLDDITEDYSVKFWINKETYVMERSHTVLKMVVDNEKTGQGEAGNAVTMEMDMLIQLSNIDGDINIELPEGAIDAIEKTDPAEGSLITGNIVSIQP